MKKCFKCEASKPYDAFYKHSMMGDGRLGKCIECTKADAKANRVARLSYYQAYDRERSRRPERKAEASVRNKRYSRPREPDPVKREARVIFGNAVRDGKVCKSPDCEVCGRPADEIHGHHHDYTAPLDVVWCCTGCHGLIHAYWKVMERKGF